MTRDASSTTSFQVERLVGPTDDWVAGRVLAGTVRSGMRLVTPDGAELTVTEIEFFGRPLDQVGPGLVAGLRLRPRSEALGLMRGTILLGRSW